MRVVYHSREPANPTPERVLSARRVPLAELLETSDVVSLHCALNDESHHLIDEEALRRMKGGAVLLNTARGKVVDSHALFQALTDGRLAAAGLDVLEEEGHIKEERQLLSSQFRQEADLHRMLLEHVLIHLPNVVVTPHNAFNSEEAMERIEDTTLENLRNRENPVN